MYCNSLLLYLTGMETMKGIQLSIKGYATDYMTTIVILSLDVSVTYVRRVSTKKKVHLCSM